MNTVVRSVAVLLAVPVTLTVTTTEPPPSSPDTTSALAAMAEMVPASSFELGSPAQLYYVDMALAWERLGIDGDPADRQESLGQFARVENFTIVPQLFSQRFADLDEARAEIGFSIVEIEQELAVLAPPDNLFIDATNVPPGVVESAVAADPTWSSELVTVETEFGPYYSWGDGYEPELERMSPLRPLGQGGQIAVIDDGTATTIRTIAAAQMEDTLATIAGAKDSAATTGVLEPVLEAVDGQTVLQLVASPTVPLFDPVLLTEADFEELLDSMVLLDPYIGTAIAEVSTANGSTTEILLVHSDTDTATSNAELVTETLATGTDPRSRQPVSDLLPGAEVSVEGPVVRVSLSEPGAFGTAFEMLQTRSLFPVG